MHLFWAIASRRLEKSPVIRILKMMDWQPVSMFLDDHMKPDRHRKGGRVPYDPVRMFRALLLGRWYSLSYGGLAESLTIRLDFLFFCGFDPFKALPDASTLNRFSLRLADLKETGAICPFEMVREQMLAGGIEIYPTDGTLKKLKVRFRNNEAW